MRLSKNRASRPELTPRQPDSFDKTVPPFSFMVGLGRFELPTNGLGNRCSIHLSYSPAPDIVIRSQPAAPQPFSAPLPQIN